MKTQICKLTSKNFEIHPEDFAHFERFGVDPPTLCPEERQRRRMAFRNDRHLYHRKCDATGKQILSLYPANSPFPVYNLDYFWSDKWDPTAYGRNFDFSRPFFEQFADLQKIVPRMSINGIGNENCDYCSFAGWSRNCYLTFTADYNEDCYFGACSWRNKDCVDFLFLFDCELCYECIDCKNCYHCLYSQDLENSLDCLFCKDLIGCSDCFGCVGLRNKKYHYFNEPLSKADYETKISQLPLGTRKGVLAIKQKVAKFIISQPRRATIIKNCENVSGDYIFSSRNSWHCFDAHDLDDCRYCSHLISAKNCMDWDYYGDRAEMCYEMVSCANDLSYCMGCSNCWGGNSNLYYCDLLSASKDCFGCISLKRGRHCILNKEYSESEYRDLLPKIISHMRSTGEWGEFFPASLSPHCYNESVANDYLPLSEEEVRKRGLRWYQNDPKDAYYGAKVETPDNINEANDDVCTQIFTCESSGAYYKIIKRELEFYHRENIPLPNKTPAQRFTERMEKRNTRQLSQQNCDNCSRTISTSCNPSKSERVYCEECYLSYVD